MERALVSHLESPVPLIPVVGKHITLSGGKRIRPAVLLLCAHLGIHDVDSLAQWCGSLLQQLPAPFNRPV